MNTTSSPDAVDTRIVLKVYAVLAWAMGLLALVSLVGLRPGGNSASPVIAITGLFTAGLIAAGC